MREYQKNLVNKLLEINNNITVNQAEIWVELLWDDFETTHAKAGREYHGSEMTEKIVSQWIDLYGSQLHEFITNNPKYKGFLEGNRNRLH